MGPVSMCCGSCRLSSSPSWKSIDYSIRLLRFSANGRRKAYVRRINRARMTIRATGMQAGKKDLLDVAAIGKAEVESLLKSAALFKDQQRQGVLHPLLPGRTLGLLFQKPSTRTRVSFEAGMNQLGGHALVLPMAEIQLSRGESVADTARVLSRYLDAIVVRTYDHSIMEEWAREATMPVINGLTDLSHPCQALSDLLTIREKKGRLKGVRIAYVGDGNNVANSLIEAAAKMGMTIALGCPIGYQPDQHVVDLARIEAAKTGAVIEIGQDFHVAVKEADVIYTDVWISMGREREQV